MSSGSPVCTRLKEIVGSDYARDGAEERYIYSRSPAGFRTGNPGCLVIPENAEEVRQIVMLAASEGIPVVPAGAGLSLSDLTVPHRGGIVMDMRRMDRIIEVNREGRYAVVEAGTTVGQLIGYLSAKHPDLRISIPDAPPSATICGNLIIFGSGHLSRYGAHSEMINGLEAVLHTGDICRLGSCSVSEEWFSRLPLPDLTSLFVYWFGGTGIITRLSVKLYPRHKIRDILIFKVESPDSIPEALSEVTRSGLIEDVLLFAMKQKESSIPLTLLQLFLTGDTPEELNKKKRLFTAMLSGRNKRGSSIIPVSNDIFPERFISHQLSEPKYGIEDAVDAKRGGGCGYIGGNFPLPLIPEIFKRGLEISEKYGFTGPLYTIRNVGMGHSVIYNIMYPFNRDDLRSIELSRMAMEEASAAIMEIGGIEWKAPAEKQAEFFKAMHHGTRDLMLRIKRSMDPEGIFNPGNWDME